jgi:hypothetical protein
MLASASPDRLGDVPTWIAGIGTVAAVVVALALAIRDSRQRDAERRRAQAEKIGASLPNFDPSDPNGLRRSLRVGNTSGQSAYRVIVSAEPIGKPYMKKLRAEHPLAFRVFIGVLPPGRRYEHIDVPPIGGIDFIWALELAFTDAAGRSWVRSASGELREIKTDPVAYYGLKDVVWS